MARRKPHHENEDIPKTMHGQYPETVDMNANDMSQAGTPKPIPRPQAPARRAAGGAARRTSGRNPEPTPGNPVMDRRGFLGYMIGTAAVALGAGTGIGYVLGNGGSQKETPSDNSGTNNSTNEPATEVTSSPRALHARFAPGLHNNVFVRVAAQKGNTYDFQVYDGPNKVADLGHVTAETDAHEMDAMFNLADIIRGFDSSKPYRFVARELEGDAVVGIREQKLYTGTTLAHIDFRQLAADSQQGHASLLISRHNPDMASAAIKDEAEIGLDYRILTYVARQDSSEGIALIKEESILQQAVQHLQQLGVNVAEEFYLDIPNLGNHGVIQYTEASTSIVPHSGRHLYVEAQTATVGPGLVISPLIVLMNEQRGWNQHPPVAGGNVMHYNLEKTVVRGENAIIVGNGPGPNELWLQDLVISDVPLARDATEVDELQIYEAPDGKLPTYARRSNGNQHEDEDYY